MTQTQTQVTPVMVPLSAFVRLADTNIEAKEYAIRDIDKKHVQILKGSLESVDPQKWPPLEATEIDGIEGVVILDGNHRREVATENSILELPVNIRSYANDAAIVEAAIRYNTQHGKPLDTGSRTRYAIHLYYSLKGTPEEESERAIAKRAGISNVTLNEAIKKEEKKRSKAEASEEGDNTSTTSEDNKTVKKFVSTMKAVGSELFDMDDKELTQLLGATVTGKGFIPQDVTDLARLGKIMIAVSKRLEKSPAMLAEYRPAPDTKGTKKSAGKSEKLTQTTIDTQIAEASKE